MNTRFLALSALASLLAIPAAAENFYWSSTAANPGDWNTLSNWKTGGDSQWDPAATALPVPGVDTVTFRTGAHTVTAQSGSTITFDQIYIGERGKNVDDPANITFNAPGATFDGPNGSLNVNDRASFTLAGGWLRGSASELGERRQIKQETPGTIAFRGASSAVSDWEILVNTYPDSAIVFSDGVHATNILLNLTPYDNGHPGNSVTISGAGTTIRGLAFDGWFHGTTNRIENGAVVENLKLVTKNIEDIVRWNVGGDIPETRLEVRNATVDGLTGGDNKSGVNYDFRLHPRYTLAFEEGSRVNMSDDNSPFLSSNGLIRVAGTGSVFTNFNFWVSSRDTRVEVADGADVLTRKFILGQHASGCTATLSGPNTLWTVTPREAKVEGFFSVGEGGDGIAASNNWFVVENGARYIYTNSLTQPGGQAFNKSVGLLIGGGVGDFGNRAVVRSGAVVENSGATSIGGGFEQRVTGGVGNLLRIEGNGTVYRGGVGYADLWDSELFFGGSGSRSNALEVADGAVAEFTGAAWFGGYYDTGLGGARISVDNASLSIATKVDCGAAALEYGPHALEVRGTNGTFRVGSIMQDNQCANTDWAWRLAFGIPAGGRTTDAPMIEVTDVLFDENKNAVVKGNCQPVFDIDRHWAQSGRGNFITLVAVTGGDQFATGEQHWWKYRDGLQAIAAKADPAQLGGCRLSVVVDREDPEVEWSTVQSVGLVLEAGAPPGTVLIVR